MALGQKIVSSSLLLISVKMLQRSLGLISTLILARLLMPEDFGVVAIAAIMLQFATVLSNSGIQQYISQKENIDDDDVNTAWSIDLSMKFTLWIFLLIGAPLVGWFYDNTEIVSVIQVVSIVVFLRALQNPGLHLLRRNLTYGSIFWLFSWQKLLSFIAVVTIAFITHSYWAIIVGDIVSALVGLVGSYMLHPYRPKFSLKKKFEQWAFTKWMFARGILGFFRAQLDNLMVSKLFSIGELGTYSVIRGISVLPATDIIVPSVEPLLASFSRVRHDMSALDHQLRASLLMVFLLIMPICAVLASYSDAIVITLLGEKWKDQGPLLANLTILLFTFSLGSILGNLYIAMGKVKLIFFYNLLSLTFIFSMLLLLAGNDLAEFALLRGVLGLMSTSLWLLLALYFTGGNILSFMVIVLTPALITYLTLLLTGYFSLQSDSIYISLAWNLVTFGVFYLLLLIVFYALLFNRIKEWRHLKDLLAKAVFSIWRRASSQGQ